MVAVLVEFLTSTHLDDSHRFPTDVCFVFTSVGIVLSSLLFLAGSLNPGIHWAIMGSCPRLKTNLKQLWQYVWSLHTS